MSAINNGLPDFGPAVPAVTPAPAQGAQSPTPRTPLSEIKELALAIRQNLKDDACPYVQEDKWVITAAAHALVILDNVAALERELNAAKRVILEYAKGNVKFHGVIAGENAEKLLNENATLRQQLAQVEKERDEASEDKKNADIENQRLRSGLATAYAAAESELTALRQWSEQAREAMLELTNGNRADDIDPIVGRMTALLATHPAIDTASNQQEGRG